MVTAFAKKEMASPSYNIFSRFSHFLLLRSTSRTACFAHHSSKMHESCQNSPCSPVLFNITPLFHII